MSFFNFSPGNDSQPDEWRVSGKIWIYWVVAIPLTILTVFAWLLWKYNREKSIHIKKLLWWRVNRQLLKLDEKA
jgi:heme/copper-type cytochrome/quinol oxidase subunit 2